MSGPITTAPPNIKPKTPRGNFFRQNGGKLLLVGGGSVVVLAGFIAAGQHELSKAKAHAYVECTHPMKDQEPRKTSTELTPAEAANIVPGSGCKLVVREKEEGRSAPTVTKEVTPGEIPSDTMARLESTHFDATWAERNFGMSSGDVLIFGMSAMLLLVCAAGWGLIKYEQRKDERNAREAAAKGKS